MKKYPFSKMVAWERVGTLAFCLGGLPCCLMPQVLAQTNEANGEPAAPTAANAVALIPKVTLENDPASWQSGEVRLNDVLFELSRPEVLRASPFEDMVRRDLLRLMNDYGNAGVSFDRALKNQKSPSKRWIGYAYAAAGDERAVPLLEEVLAQTPQPVLIKADAVDLTYLLICLSSYYEKKGDLLKAADTQLRAFDYVQEGKMPKDPAGAKVPVAGMMANQLIAAARLYRRAGEDEKAKQLYAQVKDFDYGWATGLAQVDEARDLINKREYESAIIVLKMPVTGVYSSQITPVKLALIGQAYFLNNNLSDSKFHLQRSIKEYDNLEYHLQNEGVEDIINLAKGNLQLIEIWTANPIHSDINSVNVKVASKATTAVIRRVQLNTLNNVKLNASVNNNFTEVSIFPMAGWDGKENLKELIIRISPEGLGQSSRSTVEVSSAEIKDFKLQIPIVIQREVIDPN